MMMNFTADAKILIPVCPELMGPTCRMPMGGVAVVRAGVAGRAGGVRRAAISGCIHCRSCDCKIGSGHTLRWVCLTVCPAPRLQECYLAR